MARDGAADTTPPSRYRSGRAHEAREVKLEGVAPLRDEGVGSWIDRRARFAPDRPAIVSPAGARTYADLAARIRRCANALHHLGVRKGDRVGWLGPNHAVFLEVLFGSAKLGAILSPVNHRLEPAAVARILADAEPRVAIVHDELLEMIEFPNSGTARVSYGVEETASEYESLVAGSPDDAIDEPVSLSDVCMLPYTSGTTGSPKGVMLTHGNLTWNAINLLTACDFRPMDVTIAIAPFFRVGGTGVNVLPMLFKGGTVVVPASVDPDVIMSAIERHHVTVGFANPDLLDALSRSASWLTADISSIRFIITGGAPVPERLIRTYFERGITFVQGYGLSEAGPVVLLLDEERAWTKAGSAGRPPSFVDVRIVRADGAPCPPGDTGELLARGPNVMAGYWNHPDATSAVIDAEGWLRTGDAARMDADGDVWIVDRVADAYTAASHLVYPGDVERVLARHPGVLEAGVVGVAIDGREAGVAFVVRAAGASLDENELLSYGREHLAEHEVPGSVMFVDALPRSPVGKLLRHELRRLATG